MKILFVCKGNICRSPMAEALARSKAKSLKIDDHITFDSAGTDTLHLGQNPDYRTSRMMDRHNISMKDIKARIIKQSDFENFDLILAMDKNHLERLLKIADQKYHHKIKLFLEFCEQENFWNNQILDPFHKDMEMFEEVYDLINNGLDKLFKKIA